MSALYMSMSANESDLVIEDDLAKGMRLPCNKAAGPTQSLRADFVTQRKRFFAN